MHHPRPAHIGTYALPGTVKRGAHIAGYALPDVLITPGTAVPILIQETGVFGSTW